MTGTVIKSKTAVITAAITKIKMVSVYQVLICILIRMIKLKGKIDKAEAIVPKQYGIIAINKKIPPMTSPALLSGLYNASKDAPTNKAVKNSKTIVKVTNIKENTNKVIADFLIIIIL